MRELIFVNYDKVSENLYLRIFLRNFRLENETEIIALTVFVGYVCFQHKKTFCVFLFFCIGEFKM